MLTKCKNLFIGLFALLAISCVFFATNQHVAQATPVDCGDKAAGYANAGAIHWCGDWFVYDAEKSGKTGVPTYKNGTGQGYWLQLSPDGKGATLHSAADAGKQYTNGAGISGVFLSNFDRLKNPFDNGSTVYCSAIKSTDCLQYNGAEIDYSSLGFSDNPKLAGTHQTVQGDYKGPGIDEAKFTALGTSNAAAATAANAKNEGCQKNAGPLGFVLCPLFESVSNSITNIVGVSGTGAVNPDAPLTTLLIVRPLAFSGTGTLQTANSSIVAIANSIYILIFLIIIFANFFDFGIDSYTIKRLLPRLVAAIIFTQFSYLICAFIIDAGNTLGFILPKIIAGAVPANAGVTIQDGLIAVGSIYSSDNAALGFLSGAGSFLILLILVIAVLAILVVALVYMIFRLFGIYLLVLAAPIAIAASVLPVTNKYFRMWGENLIKLNLMLPMVTSLLALSSVVSGLMIKAGCDAGAAATICKPGGTLTQAIPPGTVPSVQGSGDILIVAGALAPLLCLMLIPKTLKWSGAAMAFAAGAVTSRLASGGRSAASKSGEKFGSGKEKTQARLAASNFGQNSRMGRYLAGGGAGALRGKPTRKSSMRLAKKQASWLDDNKTAAGLIFDRESARIGEGAAKLKAKGKDSKAYEAAEWKSVYQRYGKGGLREPMTLKAANAGNDTFVGLAKRDMGDAQFRALESRDYGAFDRMPDMRTGYDPSKVSGGGLAAAGPAQGRMLTNDAHAMPASSLVSAVKIDSNFTQMSPDALKILKEIALNTGAGATGGNAAIPPSVRNDLGAELTARGL